MRFTRIAMAALIVAFLFLVPIIPYSVPLGVYNCPANGCQFVRYGSITYWAFGIGATWRDVRGYSFEVAPLSTTIIVNSTSSVSYTCNIPGGPAGAFLRILSDSTLEPVKGAVVTATHSPASCTPQTTQTFTTNSTEWVSLDVTNGGHYSFTVEYSGHTYNFTAPLRPVSVTCTTMYVPSGRTNSTITEFKSICP